MPIPIQTILLAEDEPLIQRVLEAALLRMGFAVRLAKDGNEGCALLDEWKGDLPQLLITDVDMPGCGGEELAYYARQQCEKIKLLFTSGVPHPALFETIAADPNARFLEKPFVIADLRAAIEELGVARAGV